MSHTQQLQNFFEGATVRIRSTNPRLDPLREAFFCVGSFRKTFVPQFVAPISRDYCIKKAVPLRLPMQGYALAAELIMLKQVQRTFIRMHFVSRLKYLQERRISIGAIGSSPLMMMVLLSPITHKFFCARSGELLNGGPKMTPVWSHAYQYIVADIVIAGVGSLWQTPPQHPKRGGRSEYSLT